MSLDTLYKLDPTSATSNSNFAGANIAENCLPSGINNALRAIGQMAAQQICYQGPSISASVSTNIAGTATGLFNPIIHGAAGNPNISSFGLVPGEQPSAAVIRFLQFSCSASLSNGAALRLQGGASRRTQPGDIGGYVHVGSSDVWHEFLWAPIDGGVLGQSISVSLINSTAINTTSLSASTFNVTSLSTSVINVAGVREFPRICFLATKNADQDSISSSQTVTFATEDLDVGGFYAANVWTPPSGIYRLSVQAQWVATTATTKAAVAIMFMKNGAFLVQSNDVMDSSITTVTQNLTTLVSANGTDTFGVAAQAGTPVVARLNTSQTFFYGERI